jgi:hypothetical protein
MFFRLTSKGHEGIERALGTSACNILKIAGRVEGELEFVTKELEKLLHHRWVLHGCIQTLLGAVSEGLKNSLLVGAHVESLRCAR